MRRRQAAIVLAVFIIVAVAVGSSRARVQVDSIAPPFAGSYLNFIDDGGTFLESRNATFQLKLQQSPSRNGSLDSVSTSASFFLVVVHTASGVTVWIANRDRPVNASAEFVLADAGAYLQSSPSSGAGTVWSVSAGASGPVRALRLRDDGNLLLLGAAGVDDHNHNDNVLWQSFDHPTDTLLPGQRLALGVALVAPASADDYASGSFRAEVKASDLKLLWTDRGQAPLTYWTATSDSRSVQVGPNVSAVAYAELGASALSLYDAASVALLQLPLPSMGSASSALRRAALDPSGQLTVWTYTAGQWVDAFDAVQSACLLPTACGPLGICSTGSGVAQCSCPAGLMPRNESYQAQGCTVAGPRSAVNCSVSAADNAGFSAIASGVGYSGNNFTAAYSLSLHSCEMLCLQNCSCVLYFYQNGSGSGPGTCYTYENVGTLTAGGDFVAYLKIFQNESPSPAATVGDAVNSRRRSLAVILGLSLAMMLLATMLLGLLIFFRLRRQRVSKARDEASLRVVTERLPARFTYAELAAATANFTREIGRGAYGVVYEGALPDGTRVAVKKLESTDDHKNFHTEIKTIGALHHVNVVSLRGYCAESGRRLLVYEHMNRGSLDRHLFSAGTAGEAPLLSWSERYAVAVGAARGLEYLHSACRDTIIHCDIKPENILLDDRGHTKVADFGLARLLPAPDSGSAGAAVTTLCGTRGYLAPEWLAHLPITDRADVYSFGMVLLELVSGRKNCHAHDRDHDHCRCVDAGGIQGSPQTHYFPAYAVQMWESGRAAELADVRLGGCVSSAEVERLVQVALWCVQEDPELRPSMHAVVLALEGLVPPGEPQMKELQFLRMYARRFDNSTLTPAAVFLLADSASSSSMSSAVLWPSTVLLNRFPSASPLSPLSAEAEDADADISAISSAQLSGAR